MQSAFMARVFDWDAVHTPMRYTGIDREVAIKFGQLAPDQLPAGGIRRVSPMRRRSDFSPL